MRRGFSFRMDPYTKKALDELERKRKASPAFIIEDLIEEYIKEGNYKDLIIKPLNLTFPTNSLKKDIRTTISIDKHLFNKLEEISKEINSPMSIIIRRLILREFKRLQEEKQKLQKPKKRDKVKG